MVTPGFIDTHVQLMSGEYNLLSVQLCNVASPEEFARIIGDFAKTIPEGRWILGGYWDHTLWGGKIPIRWSLLPVGVVIG